MRPCNSLPDRGNVGLKSREPRKRICRGGNSEQAQESNKNI